MPGIGIGISPLLNRGGGTDWSSYWKTLTPVFVIPDNAYSQKIMHSLGDEIVVYVTYGDDINKLMYSNDNGVTFINKIDMSALFTPVFVRIMKNGNIMIADGKKGIYYSDDKLLSLNPSSVLGIDGNPYVYHTPANAQYPGGYWANSGNFYDNGDVVVYGNYANAGVGASPVNMYYTLDGGETWRVFYTFGQNLSFTDDGSAGGGVGGTLLGDPSNPLVCRHIHAINKGYDGNYYVGTGESGGGAHFMKCIYDAVNDGWQVSDILSTQSTQYERFRSLGVYERNGYLYWGGDGVGTQTVGGIVYKSQGIFRCRVSDIDSLDKHELLMDLDDACYSFVNSGRFVFAGMMTENFICFSSDYGETFEKYTKDDNHIYDVSQIYHNELHNYWCDQYGKWKIEIRHGDLPNADPYGLTSAFNGDGNLLTVLCYSNTETGYLWERSSDGVMFEAMGTTGAGVKTYLDDEYVDEAVNYYRCRAVKVGYSSYSPIATADNRSFITTWNTENAGSATKTVVIPTSGAGYNFWIKYDSEDWINITGTPGNLAHEFTTMGIKTIKIRGTFPRIYFNGGGDRLKLLTVEQWGNIAWQRMDGAFYGCANLTGNYDDTPNTVACTTFYEMFRGCILFNSPVSFNTANVTNMYRMFYGCTNFNQSVSSFNTSKVVNMFEMFRDCANFNQSVSSFNTSLNEYFKGMFYGCTNFNQSVSNFDTSKATDLREMFYGCTNFNQSVSNFDTSKVTLMAGMFRAAAAFNQSLVNFNTALVTDISQMFRSATSFNQSIAHFNVGKITTAAHLFTSAPQYSTANYDALLIAWAAQTVLTDVALGMSTIKYSAAAAAARAVLADAPNSWVITDGGQV